MTKIVALFGGAGVVFASFSLGKWADTIQEWMVMAAGLAQ